MEELRVLPSTELFICPSYYCKHRWFFYNCLKILKNLDTQFLTINNSTIDNDLNILEVVSFLANTHCPSKVLSSLSCI